MSYDQENYQAMRSAGVPHKMALSLAKTAAVQSSSKIEPLASDATSEEITRKLNEIIDHLNGDG